MFLLLCCIAHDTGHCSNWEMSMDQSFGLVAFKFPRILGITFEIPSLENRPVYSVKPLQIIVKFCCLKIGVAVGKYEIDAAVLHLPQRGYQDSDLFHRPLCHAIESC